MFITQGVNVDHDFLAIYSYFAETEREFISVRTKQGLAAARKLDAYKDQIEKYLKMGSTIMALSQA